MKVCDCGGMFYRHGIVRPKLQQPAVRYRCKACGKCITVRDGQIVKGTGPRVQDWRMAA